MTTAGNSHQPEHSSAAAGQNSGEPRKHFTVLRVLAIIVVSIVLIVGCAFTYMATPHFSRVVRYKLIAVLESATGGRVELAAFHWNIWRLEFEADELTIHGLESPTEIPYAHADKVRIRLKIVSLLHPRAGLRFFALDNPVFHLIVYPDGTTNQPRPKYSDSNANGTVNTIFDLQARSAYVNNGLIILNQRRIPFNVSARDVHVEVHYLKPTDRYSAQINAEDVSVQTGKRPELASSLEAQLEVGRDLAQINRLHWGTARSSFDITGKLVQFADPTYQAAISGVADARDIVFLTGLNEIKRGTFALDLSGGGHGEDITASGKIKLAGVDYRDPFVAVDRVNVSTSVAITPTQITFPDFRAAIVGGTAAGSIKLTNWQNVAQTQGVLDANVNRMDAQAVLRALVPRQYSELNFNTGATGRVTATWTGLPENIILTGKLKLDPLSGARGVPAQGYVDATYNAPANRVIVRQLQAKTPGSTVQAQGMLDVALINSQTSLQVSVTTTDLAEFDGSLAAVGIGRQARSPSKTLPVALHGEAAATGRLYGPLTLLRFKGHVDVTNFDMIIPHGLATTGMSSSALIRPAAVAGEPASPMHVAWDSLHSDVDVSEYLVSVENLSLAHGKTVVHGSASLAADQVRRNVYKFDKFSAIEAKIGIANASVTDIASIAGKPDLPVTGTVNLNVNVGGQIDALAGGGHLSVIGGAIDGIHYRSLTTDIHFAGSEVQLQNLVFLEDGGRLDASASYDLVAKSFTADTHGSNFHLAEIPQLHAGSQTIAGTLSFHLAAHGTASAPSLNGDLHIADLALTGRTLGRFDADVTTQGKMLTLTASSNAFNSHLQIAGHIEMTGDYQSQVQVNFNGLDAAPLLAAYGKPNFPGHSDIAGTVVLNGPLMQPRQLDILAQISQFKVTAEQYTLSNDGPLVFAVKDGVLGIQQLHIKGPNTDFSGKGDLQLTGDRRLNVHAEGSINMQVAQTFSSNIISSGFASFTVTAHGRLSDPDLTGNVQFKDAEFSLLSFPNGLSHMNGTLEFNQDRLEVRKFTAQTGGGTVTLGGFVTYHDGLYAALTAKARDVRIRYPAGISATADADLRVMGSPTAATISGTVEITRFGIVGNVALTSNGATISEPPDPNALSSHIALDIRITSSPELDFENSYATLSGDVDLRVRGSIAAPSVLGRVEISQGTATFAGTKYQLQRGDIYFSNPVRIDPVFDLDASARVRDYDIDIGVHGTLDKLTTTYRSEPPLAQSDIIALLALGRTQEQSQIYQQEQAQAGVNSTTNALLGGALNATVSNRAQKLFGVGQVKIDPNFVGTLGQSTARVTVVQQLSHNITLTYATNVNETSQQLIQMEIALTRNLSLLAVRDEAGVFSMSFRVHQRRR